MLICLVSCTTNATSNGSIPTVVMLATFFLQLMFVLSLRISLGLSKILIVLVMLISFIGKTSSTCS
jgi:hypothetical protein